ncbi:MAG: Ig-like domain-containing protein [Candidatus Delongbacteria bacterium]|nr:Ig-like domain-containing protein [Candidatus Delongbacteria bacterium]
MKIIIRIILTVLSLMILSCATDYKRAPYGGPEDKSSPVITASNLPDNSLNVDKNSSIKIDFSEYIDRNSTRNALDISPRSAKNRSEVLWYDKSLKINFSDLAENTTVVININPSLKDLRGNPLTDSYSISFSTGDIIEKRKITGKINGAISGDDIVSFNYSRVRINLYDISSADSLLYERAEPEYSAGISSDNSFELKNLTSGIYRIIAFNDLNNDLKPQFDKEMFSFEKNDADLMSNDSLNYIFTLGWNDAVPPFIKNTSLYSNNILKIEFSEVMAAKQKLIDSLYINDTPSDFEEFFSESGGTVVYAKTGSLATGDAVKIKLRDIIDGFGNFINPDFKSKVHNVTDSVAKYPFRITGKIPVKIASDQILSISTNDISNDSLDVKLIHENDSTITGLKRSGLNDPFTVSFGLKDNKVDPGNYEMQAVNKDSVVAKNKITVEEALGYGSISGTVTADSCDSYMLVYKNVEKGEKKIEPVKSGEYRSVLRPGKYLCAVFENCDSSGVFGMDIYSNRNKKAVFFSDTVLVRRNWESTEINFNFNR